MFREKYFELKEKKKNFIIIMKNGIFYNVLGKDCYILKNIEDILDDPSEFLEAMKKTKK